MADERKLITVRVSEELHRELRLLAADKDVSLGELCADALKEWRDQRPEKVTVSTALQPEANIKEPVARPASSKPAGEREQDDFTKKAPSRKRSQTK